MLSTNPFAGHVRDARLTRAWNQRGEPPKTYLFRVFVDIGRKPAEVSPISRIQSRDRPEAESLLIVLDTTRAL